MISDEWSSYNKLKSMNYNHRTVVNHSKNFVDPLHPEIHTQTIENRWGQLKALMKKNGRTSREQFPEKIKEFTWRINYKNDIQQKMLEIIKKVNE